MAYQYKTLPAELNKYKLSEIADAIDSLNYAGNKIKAMQPQK